MAKLYGSVRNETGKVSTRCAHREITATTQSWEGSLIVSITIDSTGAHIAQIGVSEGSADEPQRIVWRGPLSAIVRATELFNTQNRKED